MSKLWTGAANGRRGTSFLLQKRRTMTCETGAVSAGEEQKGARHLSGMHCESDAESPPVSLCRAAPVARRFCKRKLVPLITSASRTDRKYGQRRALACATW